MSELDKIAVEYEAQAKASQARFAELERRAIENARLRAAEQEEARRMNAVYAGLGGPGLTAVLLVAIGNLITAVNELTAAISKEGHHD